MFSHPKLLGYTTDTEGPVPRDLQDALLPHTAQTPPGSRNPPAPYHRSAHNARGQPHPACRESSSLCRGPGLAWLWGPGQQAGVRNQSTLCQRKRKAGSACSTKWGWLNGPKPPTPHTYTPWNHGVNLQQGWLGPSPGWGDDPDPTPRSCLALDSPSALLTPVRGWLCCTWPISSPTPSPALVCPAGCCPATPAVAAFHGCQRKDSTLAQIAWHPHSPK